MRNNLWIRLAVCAVLGLSSSCTTVRNAMPPAAWRHLRARNEGYSLLYELVSKNADVNKILMIKHTDRRFSAMIKEIAQTCGEAQKQLEQFREQDLHLNLTVTNLPVPERNTRKAIASTETRLLLTSSGKDFEIQLALTQIEAMNYAAHLAKVLQEQDDNELRKSYLERFSKRCSDLRDQMVRFLE
jgi:hypothetical protein